ncbi:NAD(P)-binding protein [Trichoderma longibrachiatum]|uniref:NAD(P)-binding protein n=1 Tax=Trichoderma longibrachiatum ATCC 18648 TaxID=983965 RepID=A0A2T4CDC3_TRILO|nr:NAD(P)-binding protein [Trichoderma longibrachiatum ATCC 18648]
MSSPTLAQPPIPPTPGDANVSGKTIIVTGGNAGLGFDAARQFLTLGASRIILACRSMQKGRDAASALCAHPTVKTTNPDAIIDAFELDLDDYHSGLCFSNRVKAEVTELDILLNNGGQVVMDYEKSKSGHERSMQVNCYTHLLISLELLPLLRSTAAARGTPSRITFTGSATQIMQNTLSKQPISPESTVLGHFDDEANFNKLYRYADSKTVVNAYVRRLAALAPSEVIVNNACPGLVRTGIDKNLPFYLKLPMGLIRQSTGRTVEEGARTLVYAAVVAGPETNGKFLQHNQIDPGADLLNTPEGESFIGKLWKESVQDVAAVDPALESYT